MKAPRLSNLTLSLSKSLLILLLMTPTASGQGMSLGWGQKPTPPTSSTNPQGGLKVQVVGGVAESDSSGRPMVFGPNGELIVGENTPMMDVTFQETGIINGSSLSAGGADSSGILDTHRMRLGLLLLKITPGPGTPAIGHTFTRWAVQVRVHLNGADDSLNTFVLYPYGSTQVATADAKPDTLNSGHLVFGGSTSAYSGEFVVTVDNRRNSPGDVVAVPSTFIYPNGIAIPLNSLFGRDFWAPYVSVRVRHIAGPAGVVTAHLVGTPL